MWRIIIHFMVTHLTCVYGIELYRASRSDTEPTWQFPCRCTAGCNRTTGECINGGECIDGFPSGFKWGGPACRTGNIAYHKPTKQSGTYCEYIGCYPADFAVDGHTSGYLPHRYCAHPHMTYQQSPPVWWYVNLGDTHRIEHIMIYNRDQWEERLSLFDLTIGNNTDILSHTVFHTQGSDYPPAGGTFNKRLDPPIYGSVVGFIRRYYRDVALCEVIIFGRKIIDCSFCPGGVSCNNLNGCESCPAGKQPPDCKKDCVSNTTYGLNCEQQCSSSCKSVVGRTCDILNGKCTAGCQDISDQLNDDWNLGDKCDIVVPRMIFDSYDTIPDSPTSVTETSVTWTWGEGAQVETSAAPYIKYRLKYSTDGYAWIDGPVVDYNYDKSSSLTGTVTGLSPGTKYWFDIQVFRIYTDGQSYVSSFTAKGIKEMSATTKQVTTTTVTSTTTSPHSSIPLIAGAAAGAVVFIALVVILLVIFINRRKRKQSEPDVNETRQDEEGTICGSHCACFIAKRKVQKEVREHNGNKVEYENVNAPSKEEAHKKEIPGSPKVLPKPSSPILPKSTATSDKAKSPPSSPRVGKASSPSSPKVKKADKVTKTPETRSPASPKVAKATASPKVARAAASPKVAKAAASPKVARAAASPKVAKATAAVVAKTPDNERRAPKSPQVEKRAEDDSRSIETVESTTDIVENIYFNTGAGAGDPYSERIQVSDLQRLISRRKKEKLPFKDEFQSIPGGELLPCSVGTTSENIKKNRYKNIKAYDSTRVALQTADKKESDYVNANYITGNGGMEKKYIASQGPQVNTVDEFWRMFWEQKSNMIIMLARVTELGVKKCKDYWPEDIGQVKTFGGYKIKTVEEDVYADYASRVLMISKGNESRRVRHLQFLGWPDKQAPQFTFPLLNFRRKYKSFQNEIEGPIVVHCSAGVGRTGTFIAIDYLVEEAETKGSVDIIKCVHSLRHQRVNMVQTRVQYEFIFDVILDAVKSGVTAIPMSKLASKISVAKKDSASVLGDQFQKLNEIRPSYPDAECEGRKKENKHKNRVQDIVPDDKHRFFLSTKSSKGNTYINAVPVNTLAHEQWMIATQHPLVETVEDFWRMVYDRFCTTIVMLEPISGQDDNMPIYWPQEKDKKEQYGSLEVTLKSETRSSEVIQRKFTISLAKGKSKPFEVCQFEFLGWGADDKLPDVRRFCDLLDQVKDRERKTQGKTAVHCLDGATRCGVYCTGSYAVDKMRADKEADVFLATRYTFIARPQFVNSVEQYLFLFELLQEAGSKQENIYANV